MPALAVVYGDVVLGIYRDVDQEAVLAFGEAGVILHPSQNGVVVDEHIVEPVT